MKFTIFTLVSFWSSMALAQVSGPSRLPIFEIAAGGAQINGARGLEMLFEIKGTVPGDKDPQALNRYVIAKIDGGVVVGQGFSELPFVDIQLDLFSTESGVIGPKQTTWTAASVLGIDIKRDISVDNDLTVRVGLFGIRGGAEEQINETTKVFMKGALDFLALSVSQRLSDNSAAFGYGGGFKGEIGAEFLGKIRVVLGEDFGVTLASPQTISYRRCEAVWNDYYGYYENLCYRESSTVYKHTRMTSNTYLRMMAELQENFSIFGQIGYSAYIVSDLENAVPSSSNGQFQFRFGVSAKL